MRFALILLLLFVAPLCATAQEATLAEADAHFQMERWEEAAAAYEEVLSSDSTVAMAWYRLGRVRHAQARHEEAIRLLESALRHGFPPVYVRFAVARAHVGLGRVDDALDQLDALAEGGFAARDAMTEDPELAALQDHSRMEEILARVARNAAPCEYMEEARQFDFWVGDWDVYDPATMQKQGENRVERTLNGCLLLENWKGANGSAGRSMNFFDPGHRTWRQLWVSDRGNVLDYTRGEFRGRTMRFEGVQVSAAGDTTHQRLDFEAVAADTVRQTFRVSRDGGDTWETTWVGLYIRSRAFRTPSGGFAKGRGDFRNSLPVF